MERSVSQIYNLNDYSSDNNKIDLQLQFIDFYNLYFTKTECSADLARFFLTFFQIYISDNDNFYIEFINIWNEGFKPFLNKNFPVQSSGHFCLYSDIHFFIGLIDDTLKTKKIIKLDKMKKIKNIFINEEIDVPKRTCSMTYLRPHSQTLDSKTTRNSSIKIEISDLVKQSSEKNIHKVKALSNNKIEISEKEKDNIIDNDKNENLEEEKNENEINLPEENNKNEFPFSEFLNKIINDNYIIDNVSLIYHFCQQCLSFIDCETLFNQILEFYESIKNDSDEKINKLIEFSNVLFIEMIKYYEDSNLLDNCVSKAEKFYYKLLSCLIANIANNKIDNDIHSVQLSGTENNIINNEKICIKDIYESKKIDLINDNLYFEIKYKKKEEKHKIEEFRKYKPNLAEFNTSSRKSVRFEYKGSLLSEFQKNFDKEDKKDLLHIKTLRNTKHFSLSRKKSEDIIKEEDEKKEESDNEEQDEKITKLYESYSDKEKSFEIYSSSDNENIEKKKDDINKNNNKKKKNKKEEEKIVEENKKNEMIENLKIKVDVPKQIISDKEKLLKSLNKILTLIKKAKEKDDRIGDYIKQVKNKIKLYKDLQNKIDKETKDLIIPRQRQKGMTGTFRQSFTLRRNIIPKREYLSKGYFCVTDWKTEEIGSQLMLISKTLLNKIYPRELYKAIFLKKDKEITSPNVVKCINKFNKLTTFIMQDILSYNKPKYRAKAYEKWVSVAEYCRINKDYDDLISIFSVFNHYIITGLKLTLKEVKTKANSTLNKIKNFCQVDGNYKKIRLDMDNCNRNGEVFIPYLGMLLRDLNFFEEKSKYINDKGYINFEKIEKIDGLFQSYFKFKYCKDENKNSIPELEFFNDLEDITEEQLDERANEIEPNTPNCKIEDKEKEKKNKKELTNIDKKYFEKYKIKDNDEDDEKDIIGESMNDEPEELLDNAFIQG